ncbi:hypothetical protein SASPL_125447 [Salvia splendens]|uniref:Protein yippee-like n=1 Tax=Salvia splendens TaxID=180675 RepID=A0A8X8XFA5_SALSN|nr:hypothetical protein SASPL_125447 [Salvia splendens]
MDELVGPRLYSCYRCRNHVCLHDDIISKAFQVKHLICSQHFLAMYHVSSCPSSLLNPTRVAVSCDAFVIGYATSRVISMYQGRHGRAFLFSHAMNVAVGAKEDRNLMTGLHTVADISCVDCSEVLGWKYERAFEASQKYKEGKFIFEKSKIVKENW